MSERRRNAIYGVVMLALVAVLAAMVSTEPVEADRVQAIGSQIKCPVCQGESIADSPAQLARDMMHLVEERVREGATDQQIIDELLVSYSGAVLLDPPPRGNTLILWLAPATEAQAATALVRLGWMAYDGNGEVETAIRLLDQALIIAPDSVVATYLKGRVLWCGAGDTTGAVELFQTLLDHPQVPADSGSQIQVDIDRATEGEGCN